VTPEVVDAIVAQLMIVLSLSASNALAVDIADA